MLGYSIPPGYRRKEPVKRPKLGPWMGVIDAILEEDKTQPAKHEELETPQGLRFDPYSDALLALKINVPDPFINRRRSISLRSASGRGSRRVCQCPPPHTYNQVWSTDPSRLYYLCRQ